MYEVHKLDCLVCLKSFPSLIILHVIDWRRVEIIFSNATIGLPRPLALTLSCWPAFVNTTIQLSANVISWWSLQANQTLRSSFLHQGSADTLPACLPSSSDRYPKSACRWGVKLRRRSCQLCREKSYIHMDMSPDQVLLFYPPRKT